MAFLRTSGIITLLRLWESVCVAVYLECKEKEEGPDLVRKPGHLRLQLHFEASGHLGNWACHDLFIMLGSVGQTEMP